MTSLPFRVHAAALWVAGVVAVLVTSCSPTKPSTPPPPSATSANSALRLPDPHAGFDYQLGGGYAPHVDGKTLVDPNWPDEYIYDTSTDAKRAGLAAIVKPWIDGCKSAGFDAVEIDNLDSHTRAGDALTVDDNIAMATVFAKQAHDAGLAIAQKNTAEESKRLRAAGYDFAITESCFKYDECADYSQQYRVVLDIEYTDELGRSAFPAACNSANRPAAMIMRDHHLATPGQDEYFYQSCHA
ncbi:MAG: hypothetical protein JWP55_3660 [Mycobacterium sp.]|nr:hypothetical protein [Mycobacterium sp.]